MSDFSSNDIPLLGRQFIEASAGTGKTFAITNLYIRALLGRGISAPINVEKILVLTFTNAATDELNNRIRKRTIEAKRVFSGAKTDDEFLIELRNTSDDREADLKLLTAASLLMDNASILTIHAFCARVLNELSLETGKLFNQKRETAIDDLLIQAAEDTFRKMILRLPSFEQKLALKIWANPAALVRLMRPFLFRTKVIFEPPMVNFTVEFNRIVGVIEQIKNLWVEANIAEQISQSGFRKGSKPLTRLDSVTYLCGSEETIEIDHEMWGIYNTDKLNKLLTKSGELPKHSIFSLIDDVWEARTIINQIKINLWHRAAKSMKTIIADIKTQTNELSLDDLLTELWTAIATSEGLPKLLVKKWPIALIDEFQDTDNLQYDIFSRIYQTESPSCLLFIGDPKQAIYQFRSADIYTYLNAKQAANNIHTLSTNWRASEPLVKTINYLFGQNQIFGEKEISYQANDCPKKASTMKVMIGGKTTVPCQIRLFENKEPLTKQRAVELCMADAAENIVSLLNPSEKKKATINQKPISAGQIAILVRSRNEAIAAQAALSLRGVKSVYLTQDSVFLPETAQDLSLILEAVIDPSNERSIKVALATRLLSISAKEIDEINKHSDAQQRLHTEFKEYQEIWASQGIASMIHALIERRQIAEQWLHRPNGERELTNLRHLAELLQQRSSLVPGMSLLLGWFKREKIGSELRSEQDNQIRLESDEDLVKIVTIHAAKGLEYDVVMIPFATFKSSERKNEPALYHQKDSSGYITRLNFTPTNQVLALAEKEKHEEDMRLLYVAITRARYLVYLGIPYIKNVASTAAGQLFKLSSCDNSHFVGIKDKLPKALFHVCSLIDSPITYLRRAVDGAELKRPPRPPILNDSWLIHSYTGINRRFNRQDDINEESAMVGYSDDEHMTHISAKDAIVDTFTFPRGKHIGIALHGLLEEIDFSSSDKVIGTVCRRYAVRLGLSQEQCDGMLVSWIRNILMTPLGCGFSLSEINGKDRISEMEFHFPFVMNTELVDLVKKRGYLANAKSDQNIDLSGVMTGLIDLIVRFNNKYYIIDYKSNFLGNSFNNYTQVNLQKIIIDHRYDLQYLIYSLALHRYLKAQIMNYDYGSTFGGVRYLFLRGMRGSQNNLSGVFSDLPPSELIEELDTMMGRTIP